MREVLTLKPEGLRKAYKAGVKIAAGTDSGISRHGNNARELFQYVDQIGMTEMDAIITATINGAALLKKENVLGTLEPGKFADLIATSGSPLDDIHVLESVPFVMKGGIIFKNEYRPVA